LIIKGGTLLTPFEEMNDPVIFIENGKIVDIKSSASFDNFSNDSVIDASGKYIVPGFVDPHTHIGVHRLEGEGGDQGVEVSDTLTPQLDVVDGLDMFDPAFDDALKGGITSVGILPGSYMSFGTSVERINIISGQGAIYKTNRKEIRRKAFLKIALGEHPKRFLAEKKLTPTTRMGIMAELRSIFTRAKEYSDKKDKKYDPKLEALMAVINKEIPVRVHVHTVRDILAVLRFAKEFDLKVILDHATEAYLLKEELKDTSIVYGPVIFSKRGTELTNLDSSNLRLMKDLQFVLTTDHPTIPIQYLDLLAGLAVSEGFSLREALALITIKAAKILGIDDRVGSIEPGKDADLVVLSGKPFEPDTQVIYTIVDGEICYHGGESK
jgi:imidazolonepropionase-like amidohydrolase